MLTTRKNKDKWYGIDLFQNEEEYFRQFVKGFVTIWEAQLDLDWSRLPDWSTVKHDSGPHLSRLPEELLPAIGKFVYLAKEETEKVSTLLCSTFM